MTEDTTDRNRVSYDLSVEDKTLLATYAGTGVRIQLDDKLDAVKVRLMLEGLRTVLQRATLRVPDEAKIEAIEAVYNELVEKGMGAFERKSPGGARGPKKADKLMALALLKGVTVDQIKAALDKKSTEEQSAILNNPKVLAKLAKMREAEVEL
jgi:hypothetical protein